MSRRCTSVAFGPPLTLTRQTLSQRVGRHSHALSMHPRDQCVDLEPAVRRSPWRTMASERRGTSSGRVRMMLTYARPWNLFGPLHATSRRSSCGRVWPLVTLRLRLVVPSVALTALGLMPVRALVRARDALMLVLGDWNCLEDDERMARIDVGEAAAAGKRGPHALVCACAVHRGLLAAAGAV